MTQTTYAKLKNISKSMALIQNAKKIKIIYMIFSAIQLYSLVSCEKHLRRKESLGYGKMFYFNNCLACHSQKSSGDEISLNDMSNYDRSDLLKRLKKLKGGQIHRNHLSDVKYSDEEINSLFIFIKNYRFPANK
jgi:cytochrome c553